MVEFVKGLGEKRIWIVGGNTVLAPLLDADLVDHLIVQVAPVLLGGGRPLCLPRRRPCGGSIWWRSSSTANLRRWCLDGMEQWMKQIETQGITYLEPLKGSQHWYWGTDYISGDLYEAEELF